MLDENWLTRVRRVFSSRTCLPLQLTLLALGFSVHRDDEFAVNSPRLTVVNVIEWWKINNVNSGEPQWITANAVGNGVIKSSPRWITVEKVNHKSYHGEPQWGRLLHHGGTQWKSLHRSDCFHCSEMRWNTVHDGECSDRGDRGGEQWEKVSPRRKTVTEVHCEDYRI